MTTAIIGLDRELAEPIRNRIRSPDNRVLVYDTPPKGYTENAYLHLEHPSAEGLWYPIDRALYYSYFPNVLGLRKAMAFAITPTYPNVRKTILHDDKDLSLLLMEGDHQSLGRGYVPANTQMTLGHYRRVVKQGNEHCGEGKFKLESGTTFAPSVDSLLEDFVFGESYRILVIGDKAWTIHYESEDWRKNVGGTQTLVSNLKLEKLYLSEAKRLGLAVAGFDCIINDVNGCWHTLEVNCYPGIPDFAQEHFINEACKFLGENK